MNLTELCAAERIDAAAVARHLDALGHAERVVETRALPRASFARLYEAVKGARALSLDDLVPPSTPPLEPVRHAGTNNLPTFRAFEKPMFRDRGGRIRGRNAQTWEAVTGPGYFTVETREPGEVLFDYTVLPEETPAGWPAVRSNARGFSYFVFRDMHDVVRAVSRHVVIGRATRKGAELPQYFILVRP